jgi:DnaJ-domain-containing protein 1
MEMREAIERASTDEQLKPLLQSCQSKQKEVIDELAVAFRENRVDDAKYLTASLQYWSKIEERIMEKITAI